MGVTPSELRAHASREVDRLGPEPASAREGVQWRERRESAAINVAALADGDPVVLARAAALAAAERDNGAHELLRDAADWTTP